ncbi:MAG TPA: thioredoxin [Alphaproteobacteria bacterium]|nr:thioredoxin [Alphaproteobacteria bacterium]
MTPPFSQLSPQKPDAPAAAPGDPVKDVGLATFMADVIEASRAHIVVVDFWAPWCGPCKQLGPALENAVRGYKGAVTLAKIDIDKNPDIARQMQIQSIPAVFAFFQGKPVDGFMGALPEAQIKSWLEKLVKATGGEGGVEGAVDFDAALKQAAEYLATGDVATAQAIYADILDQDPAHAAAYAGLLRCLVALGDVAQAKRMLESAPESVAKDKVLDSVRAAIEVAEQAGQSGSLADLAEKVARDPADHQARFDLALAHYAKGEKEQAADRLLDIVRRDRAWNDEAARKQLVKFFEAMGPTDPVTIAARKRLSSILFA